MRLAKWYTTLSQKDRAKIVREITPMVISRPLKLCNFLDWKDQKLVYKRYASLYFVAGVDAGAKRGVLLVQLLLWLRNSSLQCWICWTWVATSSQCVQCGCACWAK